MSSPLTVRQKAFCANIVIEKMSQTQAYIAAGYADSKAANPNAARLIARDSVKAYLEELQEKHENRRAYKKENALARLQVIAESGEDHNSIAAIREMGKMTSWYTPEKVEHSINGDIVALMRVGRA